MFEHKIHSKQHHTGKEGLESYEHWCKEYNINAEDFPFRVKMQKTDSRGFQLWLNVGSWGFYQGSDWRWYFFVSYHSSDRKMTVAYHWDCGEDGFPTGTPRRHQWVN